MENKTYTMDFAGYPLSFNFGHYAEQADGSVLVRMGDTAVLVNVCASPQWQTSPERASISSRWR